MAVCEKISGDRKIVCDDLWIIIIVGSWQQVDFVVGRLLHKTENRQGIGLRWLSDTTIYFLGHAVAFSGCVLLRYHKLPQRQWTFWLCLLRSFSSAVPILGFPPCALIPMYVSMICLWVFTQRVLVSTCRLANLWAERYQWHHGISDVATMNEIQKSHNAPVPQPTMHHSELKCAHFFYSVCLALCAGNSPVTGQFPSQRPVTRGFDILFDLRLNKRLSKRSRHWWFKTPLRSLWRHYND